MATGSPVDASEVTNWERSKGLLADHTHLKFVLFDIGVLYHCHCFLVDFHHYRSVRFLLSESELLQTLFECFVRYAYFEILSLGNITHGTFLE